MSSQKFLRVTIITIAFAIGGILCVPSQAAAACSASTIAQRYGFHFDGFVGSSAPPTPVRVPAFGYEAVAGEISFTATSDSDGTLEGSESGNIGGQVFRLTFTGKYTITDATKCTGSLTRTLPNGVTFSSDFVIVEGGNEIEFVSTTDGIVEQGVMKKQ